MITLQQEPGFIRQYLIENYPPDFLDKYQLEGTFRQQKIQSFYLINIESTLYFFFTGILLFVILQIITKIYLSFFTSNHVLPNEKNIGFLMR